jgi:hypothetical protein
MISAFRFGPLWLFKLARPWGKADSILFLSGAESQGGVIRAESARVQVWSWVDHRCGAEIGCISALVREGGAERSSGAAHAPEAGRDQMVANAGDVSMWSYIRDPAMV